jgi:hypothetical protein
MIFFYKEIEGISISIVIDKEWNFNRFSVIGLRFYTIIYFDKMNDSFIVPKRLLINLLC